MYKDWRLRYDRSKSTKKYITVVINQVMKETIRDGHISKNPILNIECLNKTPEKPRDALTDEEIKNLYPTENTDKTLL